MNISVSIVYYHPGEKELEILKQNLKAWEHLQADVIICDNSEYPQAERFEDLKVRYFHLVENPGYGIAHNFAIERSDSELHLVLNPDVLVPATTLEGLAEEFKQDPSLGLASPRICFPDGRIQYVHKLPANPIDFAIRFVQGKIGWLPPFLQARFESFEMRGAYESGAAFECGYISGCFMLFRRQLFETVGVFDPHFFMYSEDADISYRYYRNSKSMVFPQYEVTHLWERGNYSNSTLLMHSLHSMIYYWSKWGGTNGDNRRDNE